MFDIIAFLSSPFFLWLKAISVVINIITLISFIYLYFTGIIPVLYRFGSNVVFNKIAIFADFEYYDIIESVILESKIFQKSNIIRIHKDSMKKAEKAKIFVVHWKSYEDEIDKILSIKRYSDKLIIFAPQDEGKIDEDSMQKINSVRNSWVVN